MDLCTILTIVILILLLIQIGLSIGLITYHYNNSKTSTSDTMAPYKRYKQLETFTDHKIFGEPHRETFGESSDYKHVPVGVHK